MVSLARTVASLLRTYRIQALTSPSGVQRRIYATNAKREIDGMGGWDGWSNGSFNFLYTFGVYRTCIGLPIYMFKNCHQHCYGYVNLISSCRVWIWFSKLIWGNVFLKNHSKSHMFQINYRPQAFFCLNLILSWRVGVWFTHQTTGLFDLARWFPH